MSYMGNNKHTPRILSNESFNRDTYTIVHTESSLDLNDLEKEKIENNLSYYACKKDFDENNISDFVKENVLKYLDPESQRKTNIQITNDITELFKDY